MGWIDWNADGNWGGPAEQIANSVNVFEGDNALTFDVPSWAKDGITFARFRLSTTGELGVRGAAGDGEVEDYAVTIEPPLSSSGVFHVQPAISATAKGARSVVAADVDGDGDMDVLSASQRDDETAWYQNDGNQRFTVQTISTATGGEFYLAAADVDGDGDMDVLSASELDDKIAWYENDGRQNFTERPISTAADGPPSVFVADVNGDGRDDVIVTQAEAGRLEAHYAFATSSGFVRLQPVFEFHDESDYSNREFLVTDVNGDGKDDVILTRAEAGTLEAHYALATTNGFAPLQPVFEFHDDRFRASAAHLRVS